MILEINAGKLVITSEDPMDAAYLESFFSDSVSIEKKSNFIHHGFHVTEELSVRVKFTKATGPKRKR